MLAGKVFKWSKQLHRWLVGLMVIASAVMIGTGVMLKYPATFLSLGFALGPARVLHAQTGGFFSLLLTLMALTGIYLYLFPLWQKRKAMAAKRAEGTAAAASPTENRV